VAASIEIRACEAAVSTLAVLLRQIHPSRQGGPRGDRIRISRDDQRIEGGESMITRHEIDTFNPGDRSRVLSRDADADAGAARGKWIIGREKEGWMFELTFVSNRDRRSRERSEFIIARRARLRQKRRLCVSRLRLGAENRRLGKRNLVEQQAESHAIC